MFKVVSAKMSQAIGTTDACALELLLRCRRLVHAHYDDRMLPDEQAPSLATTVYDSDVRLPRVV